MTSCLAFAILAAWALLIQPAAAEAPGGPEKIDLFERAIVLESAPDLAGGLEAPAEILARARAIAQASAPERKEPPRAEDYWLYLRLDADSELTSRVLRVRPESFAPIDLYLFEGGRLVGRAGYGLGREESPGAATRIGPGGTFLLQLGQTRERELLLRMHANNPPDWTTVLLLSPRQHAEHERLRRTVVSLTIAALVIMATICLYGLAVGAAGASGYFLTVTMAIVLWSFNFGLIQDHLDFHDPEDIFGRVSWCLIGVGYMGYFSSVFEMKRAMPRLHLAASAIAAMFLLLAVSNPLLPPRVFYALNGLPWTLNAVVILAITSRAVHLRLTGGVANWIAWSGSLVFFAPAILNTFGLVPFHEHILLALTATALWQLAFMGLGIAQGVKATYIEKQRIEMAERSRTQFLAEATHDLRQPVYALALMGERLRRLAPDASTKELAERMAAAVGTLSDMLTDLLDMTRLAAGRLSSEVKPVPLQSVFDALRDELEPVARARGLALRFVPTKGVARSDGLHLMRILRNLALNALNYTKKGGLLIGVRRAEGSRLRIEVHDTGPGIPEQERARMFQAFQRGSSGQASGLQGLGLGLAIVRDLALLLGVPVGYRPGRRAGSVFHVTLSRAAALDAVAASAEARPLVEDGGLTGRRILVLDNDPEVLRATCDLLRQWGASPIGAASRAEAELAGAQPLDAAILDWRLETETGLDALMKISRGRTRPLPAIFITGETSAATIGRILATGHPYLAKPLGPARLGFALRRLIEGAASTGGG